jgi:hypothetical protein
MRGESPTPTTDRGVCDFVVDGGVVSTVTV